ncbi:LuxR C-terminal-related transcriptional regulator [uncultured Nitratireductor sp.]|uniref:response regulator transcription factor n=1 Tax=uncultured Nitratireductor sp. TaxID=520953 RepID=UPI0026245F66|nr:LuxR C-terminal-related transcriptional regulator [uncultured Nitratireductor sp.]
MSQSLQTLRSGAGHCLATRPEFANVATASFRANAGLSEHTVGDYVKSIYKKLQVTSRAQATRIALETGLVRSGSR